MKTHKIKLEIVTEICHNSAAAGSSLVNADTLHLRVKEILDISRRKPAEGISLLICICNFHVLSHLLLIYICKLHWNLNTMFVCQVNSF